MSETLFDLPGYTVALLRQPDAPALQDLMERCSDYSVLHDGAPPHATQGEEEIVALPQGKEYEDKFLAGIRSVTGELVGVLDLIRDFPAAREWWVGLLMLDPRERASGFGTRIYRTAAVWVARQGGERVLLGVLEQNPGAERFWRRLGFQEIRRQPYTSPTGHQSTLIMMGHDLAP